MANNAAGLASTLVLQCDIDEDIVLTNAKRMVELGFVDLGYNYMNVDDCWAEKNRSVDGFQLASASSFLILSLFSVDGCVAVA